jgi:hypothetical protein
VRGRLERYEPEGLRDQAYEGIDAL